MENYIYPNSQHTCGDSCYKIIRTTKSDILSVTGSDSALFEGEFVPHPESNQAVMNEHNSRKKCDNGKEHKDSKDATHKLCPLTVENSKIIRRLFDFTNPKSSKGNDITIGLGDRLGLATAGHIRLLKDYDVFPIFAQQSIRELNLTGRTYEDVLSSAVWAVFREGYKNGYGADGDHLKTREEVKYALDCGFTMITLDCSEHIPHGLEAVVKFTTDIYHEHIRGKNIDCELSIDETQTVTTPEDHLFVAQALKKSGVEIRSLAPRFCGEFQKGIDYIGDVKQFEREFKSHVEIAEKFGYKISIHSGSDKFSIFPIVGKLTGGKYHLKTAGTNWLEAVRVVATTDPALYREMHLFALENLEEARKYYHITCDLSKIKPLADTPDIMLPSYLDEDNARQVLHITYGLILQAKKEDGTPRFHDRIYRVLRTREDEYTDALEKHIGMHLIELGLKRKKAVGN
ncbi:MAG: tagaturonate epimerase family protein [Oscillospiraceae bacterium]|nr:tagaturonate epimerase family protein [Oscillospiraceae bacterium]